MAYLFLRHRGGQGSSVPSSLLLGAGEIPVQKVFEMRGWFITHCNIETARNYAKAINKYIPPLINLILSVILSEANDRVISIDLPSRRKSGSRMLQKAETVWWTLFLDYETLFNLWALNPLIISFCLSFLFTKKLLKLSVWQETGKSLFFFRYLCIVITNKKQFLLTDGPGRIRENTISILFIKTKTLWQYYFANTNV